MEYIIFIAVVIIIFVCISLNGYLEYKKDQKRFIKKLYEKSGELPYREYKAGEFERISHYFNKHKEGFYLDDITWNDLSMDDIFVKMNYTYSAAGEEYLYYTLRTPLMSLNSLNKREDLISFFMEHDDERVESQVIFAKMGRTGKFSIYDYLDYLDDLGMRSNLQHYVAFLGMLFAVLFIFINLPVGLLALVCVLCFNIISYFRIKNDIEPYITSFSYIFRLMDAAQKLQKIQVPALKEDLRVLKNSCMEMSGFKRGSFWLMSPSRMSGSINPLDLILDYLRMSFHFDLLQFNKMLKEVRKHTATIDKMLTIIGNMEAMIAIGAYRKGKEAYCIPELSEQSCIHTKNMYHPMIERPVKNDLSVNRSVLITGSNASGKSTFLKTVAINAILAQTIHTCLAESYRGGLFRICSSMSLRDDLLGGESYYMVEIKALKRIMDEIKKEGLPVLCFVDEVLRGTNTVERIAASAQILESMDAQDCLCFAATHDIELTHLLEERYENYHFEEEILDNDIYFSYKIIEGRATTRNAIKLLSIMGYHDTIIKKAEKLAADFMANGKWK